MEKRLKEIMSDILNLNPVEINSETSMETTSSWDSMKHMQLITAIEENFDISRLTMDEIVAMVQFGKMVEILQSKGL